MIVLAIAAAFAVAPPRISIAAPLKTFVQIAAADPAGTKASVRQQAAKMSIAAAIMPTSVGDLLDFAQ